MIINKINIKDENKIKYKKKKKKKKLIHLYTFFFIPNKYNGNNLKITQNLNFCFV